MVNLDITNSKTLTILVIVCVLVFTCVYIMVIQNENKEGFANFPLASGDTVRLVDGLPAVKLGASGNRNVSDIMNELVPPLTVISYFGSIAPTGWQLCDGKNLKFDNNQTFVYDNNGNPFATPNLQGRTLVGMTYNQSTNPPLKDETNKDLLAYPLGRYKGAEKHVLTNPEMPSHSHPVNVSAQGGSDCGPNGCPAFGTTTYSKLNADGNGNIWQAYASNVGGNQPHNNMQPYYVLNYIIKQPMVGSGFSPSISNTNSPSV
jgi:microcystin-dependent protein